MHCKRTPAPDGRPLSAFLRRTGGPRPAASSPAPHRRLIKPRRGSASVPALARERGSWEHRFFPAPGPDEERREARGVSPCSRATAEHPRCPRRHGQRRPGLPTPARRHEASLLGALPRSLQPSRALAAAVPRWLPSRGSDERPEREQSGAATSPRARGATTDVRAFTGGKKKQKTCGDPALVRLNGEPLGN